MTPATNRFFRGLFRLKKELNSPPIYIVSVLSEVLDTIKESQDIDSHEEAVEEIVRLCGVLKNAKAAVEEETLRAAYRRQV